MKCIDITEEVHDAKLLVEANESWEDYISWKDIKANGYENVIIEGETFSFSKWGLTE